MSCIFLLFFLASLEFNLAPFAQNLQTRSFYTLMMVWFFFLYIFALSVHDAK